MHTQDYNDLTGPQLVSTYNDLVVQSKAAGLSGYRLVVRFADKISAVKRCEALASSLRAREEGLKMLNDDPPVTGGDDPSVEQEHTKADFIEEVYEAPVVPLKKVRKTKTKTKVAKGTKVIKAKATKAVATETDGRGPRIGTKTEIVASLLKRKSGCTAAEVLNATGWPAVSMPAMAKACGLELRRVKEAGSPMQYYGY